VPSERLTAVATELRRTAAETPERRERHVDVVRAVAIGVVVLGHWMAVAVTETNGVVDGVNALEEIEWAHPLTWAFQVMPLFFFIGGYANAASLASNRERGGDALAWVLGRFQRIVWPAVALVAGLGLAVVVARVVGVGHDTAATAAWLASIPLWFLAAYLGVLLLAPVTFAAHRRWGLAAVVALGLASVTADILRLAVGWTAAGNANHLVVWIAVHQLGYAWRDGRLPARPAVGLVLAGAGLVTVLGLTLAGPYPVSMVGVPGEELQNTAPPTVALLALGLAQVGLVLAVRDRSERWANRPRAWLTVVSVNAVILTVFLWHMAAALVAALVLYAPGALPVVEVGSGAWFAQRLVWLIACAIVLGLLLVAFGGIEVGMPGARPGTRVEVRLAALAGWAGAVLCLTGMLGIAVAGDGVHGPLGLPTPALAAFGSGVALVHVASRARRSSTANATS
jgi:hypothetical protein